MIEFQLVVYFVEAVLHIQERRNLALEQVSILLAVKVVRRFTCAAREKAFLIAISAQSFHAKNLEVSLRGG